MGSTHKPEKSAAGYPELVKRDELLRRSNDLHSEQTIGARLVFL